MQCEDDVVRDREFRAGVESGLRDGGRRPELYYVELALGRGRDAHELFCVCRQDRLEHRVNHKIDGRIADVRRGDLLAPRPAMFVFGHLPDRANAFSHEEEVAALKGLAGYLGNDAPELLRRLYFCNQLVVREAPVILAGVKVPQNPRFLEFCGLRRHSCSLLICCPVNNPALHRTISTGSDPFWRKTDPVFMAA